MPSGLPIKVVSPEPSARDVQDRMDLLAAQPLELPGARPAGWREGLRLSVWRRQRWLTLYVSWDDVADLGPRIHAMARRLSLGLMLPQIGWTVQPEGQDHRIWDAIQRGAEDSHDELLMVDRGQFDPYRFVHVSTIDDTAALTIDEAAFVPRNRPRPAYVSSSYDNWGWHAVADRFADVDDPVEAFVHIGMFLTWAISHDLMDPSLFDASTIAAVRARDMIGTDLRHDVDGKLVAGMLSDEGRSFADWYYGAPESLFLDDWVATFGEAANEYSVPNTWATYDQIADVIDRRFEQWKSGLPAADQPT
jgi:hypothetical protein